MFFKEIAQRNGDGAPQGVEHHRQPVFSTEEYDIWHLHRFDGGPYTDPKSP
jgi:hypothetical protein